MAFVLGQRSVALELCAKAFEAQNPDPAAPVVLLSEPACAHALGEGFSWECGKSGPPGLRLNLPTS